MPEPKRPLKVFLCHAHADRDPVRELYTRLTKDGVDAWLDKVKLLPGQDWELEIRKAVREADVVVVCLSKQFNQAGFRQKEVRLALDTAMEKPEGEIFIIPARLEECDNLESLRRWHWVDLFEDDGYEMLMRALRARADRIGAALRVKNVGFLMKNQEYTKAEKRERKINKPFVGINIKSVNKPNFVALLVVAFLIIFLFTSTLIVYSQVKTGAIRATETSYSVLYRQNETQTAFVGSFLFMQKATPTTTPFVPNSCVLPYSWLPIIVESDETLESIATSYGLSVDEVRRGNCLLTDNLAPGSVIYVPAVSSVTPISCSPGAVGWVKSYIVQPGDTMYGIAKKHNVSTSLLKQVNCLVSDLLYSNMILWVPNIAQQTLLPFTQTSLPFTLTPFSPSTPTPFR